MKKKLKKEETHRRGGPHVDGNYCFGWGGGGGGWSTGEKGRYLTMEKHLRQYFSSLGGMFIASSYSACRVWLGEFSGISGQRGSCEHIMDQFPDKESFLLKPNTLYFLNSLCAHESMPVDSDINRQILRITMPEKYSYGI